MQAGGIVLYGTASLRRSQYGRTGQPTAHVGRVIVRRGIFRHKVQTVSLAFFLPV